MSIRIQPLEPQYIPKLAAWHQAEWAHLDRSLDEPTRQARLEEHCSTTSLPATFIALDGDTLVGGICLAPHDIPDRPQYSPWISRIYVTHDQRGKAIGKALIDHAKEALRQQGHEALYLITEDKGSYYAKIGWLKVEDYRLNEHPVEIMRIALN
ncbi:MULTISPECIES: GNAT family N-acetyltransferase [unclassified Marinobacter]|jgi:predicted N-acetyltransferase YhbS|uniref:GNAT family N-acetyltransferase n=1 Tax=unclassified Marinobacter TaxID=83889 RepID=UPI0020108FE9|nr:MULTISPECIES: GNAT family N-acetyltransferase [unclassified Marinobacter]UQG55360.1 GNAT family N-acetyltransferase [Marinobacter sp. M4C]UQG64164.1 GNAT family N-acetyltransferase [Marinobacter sp. M2C]UQG68443.1 GNAT family N-acetyltransferase [Marinobacter sp. M1C]